MINVPFFFTDTILRDYKNATVLWMAKKDQKVHKIVMFVLCIYTGAHSFLHCMLTHIPELRTSQFKL
jgi:hypothetical protein